MSDGVTPQKFNELRDKIMDEISFAMGLGRSGLQRMLIRPLVWLPASRFARVAARFDQHVPEEGIPGGARQLLGDLRIRVLARGADRIPTRGPLLIVSNHPGAYDSVAIASQVPRADLKILASDVPFLRAVPHTNQKFIYVPSQSNGKMAALRQAIQHLQSGGALMIFAHGDVEPDPGFMQGAWEAIGDWSASVEVMLRKVPEAWLQVVIASDVLFAAYVRSPLTRLRSSAARQQKLAEVFQVIQQLVLPGSLRNEVRLSFARPVRGSELGGQGAMGQVVEIGRQLLAEHLEVYHSSSRPLGG